jgi:hypothetical protein
VHVGQAEVVGAPHRIEMKFEMDGPGAWLRITAPSPTLCKHLFEHMQPHVDAGARRAVWSPEVAGGAGACVGLAIADALFVGASLRSWVAVPLALGFGAGGWLGGDQLVRWTFPSLELVEAWERTRWQRVLASFWQLLLLALAVAGIVVAIVLAK